ncbi:MAG TPA: hypothetical protein VL096_16345, partial [Pirellulaceae bacterium]|nr:hypothetical protein [Pirellulaceae bacterium]
SKWQTSQYAVGRMLIAPRRLLSQSLLYAYKHVWPALRRWRKAPRLLTEKVTVAEEEATHV